MRLPALPALRKLYTHLAAGLLIASVLPRQMAKRVMEFRLGGLDP